MKRYLKKIKKKYRTGGVAEVVLSMIAVIYAAIKTRIMMLYLSYSSPVYGLNTTDDRKQKVIVSLTSFPPRFPMLHICIKSLLRQTYKPDRIILYLGSDTRKDQISDNILQLTKFGLEIVFVPDNLKAHKKYYYAMMNYPNDIIIITDDDNIYSPDTLQSLMLSYTRYPKAISARSVHKILADENGILPFKEFLHFCRDVQTPSMQLYAVNVGGTLYPPFSEGLLYEDVTNIELIKNPLFFNDDIWLKFMAVLKETPYVWVPSGRLSGRILSLPSSKFEPVSPEYDERFGPNDAEINKLQEYYDVRLAEYCDVYDK